jgi:histidinol dehydrogenase
MRDELLRRTEDDLESYIEGVKPIIESVKKEGDAALARLGVQFDQAPLTAQDIPSSKKDMDEAFDLVGRDMIEVLEYSADNIRRFHEAQLPTPSWTMEIRDGVTVGERYTPIDSVA